MQLKNSKQNQDKGQKTTKQNTTENKTNKHYTLFKRIQMNNKEGGDDTVPKVKAIRGESFHKAAALEVVKLVQG